MKLKLELVLLSDALPGSGESEAGAVDRDVIFDEFGLPEIPAKRIKGIIVSSARDLVDWNALNNNDIESIFGSEGSSKTIFNITNGFMEHHTIYRNFLRACRETKDYVQFLGICNKQTIQQLFSYNRTQTSVMRKRSISVENSLRISRVLRKGLKFYFEIQADIKDETEIAKFTEDLRKICKIAKNFGSSRTRGLGEIKLRVINVVERDKSIDRTELKPFNDEDICAINLNLTNIEQLLVSNSLNGQQRSELFIRGSYILGALAKMYIMANDLHKNAHNDPEFQKIFLSGDVHFTNFYLSINDIVFLPTPFSIVREKGKENYFDLAYEPNLKTVADREKSIQTELVGGFSSINSLKMQNFSPSTKIESHNRRPRDRRIGHALKAEGQPVDVTGAYFHYDVLEPNYQFKGQIIGKFKNIKNLIKILPQESTIYVGKSKTAQYGRCICKLESIENYDYKIQNSETNRLIITLTSDMILTNDRGYLTPDSTILKNEINKALGIGSNDSEIHNTYLKFTKVGGYNSTWGLPKIQGQALAAGSVLVLKRTDGQVFNAVNMNKFAFGLRTSEGYGRITVNSHGFSNINKEALEAIEGPAFNFLNNYEVLKDLVEFCLIASLKSAIGVNVFNAINSSKYRHIKISGSFLQRLLIFVKSSDSIEIFNNKLINLKDKASNQLKKIKEDLFIDNKTVNEKAFNDWLKNLSKEQIDFTEFEPKEISDLELANYYSNKFTELYFLYCSLFITSIILKTREVKKNE